MTLAFVFPGHGSQLVGMLDSLSSRPAVRETLQEASDTLGKDIAKLIAEGPEELFSFLPVAAVITVTTGVACFRAWQETGGPQPDIVAGHSHGEYSALVASGVISFKDALEAVQYRGTLMQSVSGSMAVIVGLGASKVIEMCSEVSNNTGTIVEAVNFNAPGQILISGNNEAVPMVVSMAQASGAIFTRLLHLPIPAHSSLLKPVTVKLHEYFKEIEFHAPKIPFINNVDVSMLDDPVEIKNAMARQVSKPVRWQEIIKSMSAKGIKQVVECGPGKVLHELTPRIDNKLKSMAFMDEPTLLEVIENLN